jgi:hypothetical protein
MGFLAKDAIWNVHHLLDMVTKLFLFKKPQIVVAFCYVYVVVCWLFLKTFSRYVFWMRFGAMFTIYYMMFPFIESVTFFGGISYLWHGTDCWGKMRENKFYLCSQFVFRSLV